MMNNFGNIVNSCKEVLVKNGPQILTGIGIAGILSGSFLACKATLKAKDVIDKKKKEENKEKLEKKEVVKAVWKVYAPSVSIILVSTATLIFAQYQSVQKIAAATAVAKLSKDSLSEYKDSVKKVLNKDDAKKVDDDVTKKKMNKANDVPLCKNFDKVLFFDEYSGRYFYSSKSDIDRAVNEINSRLFIDGDAEINDFYELIDAYELEPIRAGCGIGWTINEGFMRVTYDTKTTPNGEIPCIVINYDSYIIGC